MANNNDIAYNLDAYTVADSYTCSPQNCKIYSNKLKSPFNIIHMNIRSINRNLDEFLVLLSTINTECHIIILSECWLSKTPIIPNIPGFISFKSGFRNQNDGLVVYIHSDITCSVSEPEFEDANCLTVKICNQNLALICLYRPPSYRNSEGFLNSLSTTLKSLSSYRNVAILGDTNIDIHPELPDKFAIDYLTTTSFYGYLPAYLTPTRDEACLDHVLLRINTNVITLILDTFITDHAPTLLSIERNTNALYKTSKTITRVDIQAAVAQIEGTDFTSVTNSLDADTSAKNFILLITSVLSNHTKTVKVPHKKQIIKPWITPGLLKCIRNRDKLHKKTKQNPGNAIVKLTYTRYRNFCNNLLRNLKRNFERNELLKAQGNQKTTWKTVNSILNSKQKAPPPIELLKLSPTSQQSID